MTRVARIIRKHNWPSWTIKEVKDCMLWYALNNGYIHTRYKSGDAILLARRLSCIAQRVEHGHHEQGRILWVEFFYYDEPIAAIHLILKAIERYEGSIDSIAFHDHRDDNPLTYRLYEPRFILKLIEHLWAVQAYRKHPPLTQPRQKL